MARTTTNARTTVAQRYNAKAREIMLNMASDLKVDPSIDCASHIDEIVFRKSEFLGGMAAVLLDLCKAK